MNPPRSLVFPNSLNSQELICNRWEAICLGAAVRGLEGPLAIRKKSRFNIGHEVGRSFTAGVDSEPDAYIDYFGAKKVSGYMHWHICRVSDPYDPIFGPGA